MTLLRITYYNFNLSDIKVMIYIILFNFNMDETDKLEEQNDKLIKEMGNNTLCLILFIILIILLFFIQKIMSGCGVLFFIIAIISVLFLNINPWIFIILGIILYFTDNL